MSSVLLAPSISAERQFDFREADFARVRRMIHERAGISLGTHKREMVYSRLARRLRALGRHDFASYLDQLESRRPLPCRARSRKPTSTVRSLRARSSPDTLTGSTQTRRTAIEPFVPPNPNEFDRPTLIFISRAVLAQ